MNDIHVESDKMNTMNSSSKNKSKSEKEEELLSILPLWLRFVLLYVLLLFILSLIFNISFLLFLVITIVLSFSIRWIFLKRFALWITIVLSIGIFFVLSGLSIFITLKSTDTVKQRLEIQVVKYPESVDCYTDSDKIKLEIKNIGNEDFSYSDVVTGKYEFGVCDGDVDITKTISCHISPANVSVLDFETIQPNEEREVIIETTGKSKSNALTEFKKTKINGDYKYFVDISLVKNKKLKPIIGKSNIFSVHTNIMDDKNERIKDCAK